MKRRPHKPVLSSLMCCRINNQWKGVIYALSMPTSLPWWYQPTGSGETGSIDRRVESGIPVIPPQIEIRDGGIFWSYDPEHRIPRVNPHADNTSQRLGQLRVAFT